MKIRPALCLFFSLGLLAQTQNAHSEGAARKKEDVWIKNYIRHNITDGNSHQAKGKIAICRDLYFGFSVRCRLAYIGEARSSNWKYLPPFKTGLPSFRLRKDLARYDVLNSLEKTYPLSAMPEIEGDHYKTNDYILNMPAFVVDHGDELLTQWESLANQHAFFNCRGAMCDVLRETRVNLSAEEIEEQNWVDGKSVFDQPQEEIKARVLELCSVYGSSSQQDSLPFLCAKVGTIEPERRLMVPAYRLSDPFELTIVAGGDEFIPTPLAIVRGAQPGTRQAAVRMLISAFVNPTSGFVERTVPGACLVASRIGQPSLVFKAPVSGASAFWETTWLRFDCEPDKSEPDMINIYMSLVLEHSYEKGMRSSRPANDTERNQYFTYLKNQFSETLASQCRLQSHEWFCNGVYFLLN